MAAVAREASQSAVAGPVAAPPAAAATTPVPAPAPTSAVAWPGERIRLGARHGIIHCFMLRELMMISLTVTMMVMASMTMTVPFSY